MKDGIRADGLSAISYSIVELILDKKEEEEIIRNIANKLDTDGVIKIKAFRGSESYLPLNDNEPNEYIIDTKDIAYFETV